MLKMKSEQIATFFHSTSISICKNGLLREPQIKGYQAVQEHFKQNKNHALLQIPVGCGKTGLMCLLPFGLANGRVLIITPNLEIRKNTARELDITRKDCFWNKVNLLKDLMKGPYRAELNSEANISDCYNAHFVVTNIHQLASRAERWLPKFEDNFFDLILIDEAHHNVAESWLKVFERFPEAKIVSLTATPFRSDGLEIKGEKIYRYPFAKAMKRGYIKQLRVADAQPSEIYFTYKGSKHRHSLEEVLTLREETWFRRGVALSTPTNETIVNSSLEILERIRSDKKQQIIAAACSIYHARQIAALYRERGYSAEVISSEMNKEDRNKVLHSLKSGSLNCIVQVNILGEGFDWPPLSIAAIFRPFRTLSPYIQFVGRVMRVLVQNDPYHPDNEGWVVSHIGLQQDERWDDFRKFDKDDIELFESITSGKDMGPRKKRPRNRIRPNMNVIDEVIDRIVTRDFLDPNDAGAVDAILAEIKRTLGVDPNDIGLSREELSGRLLQARRRQMIKPTERPVQPQERRRELRSLLDKGARSVAIRILESLNISPSGVDLIKYMPGLKHNNFAAAIRLMHSTINDNMSFKPKTRHNLNINQLKEAIERIDEFGDILEERLREYMEGEE